MTEECPYLGKCATTQNEQTIENFRQNSLYLQVCGSKRTYESCFEYQMNSELDEQISHDLRENPSYRRE